MQLVCFPFFGIQRKVKLVCISFFDIQKKVKLFCFSFFDIRFGHENAIWYSNPILTFDLAKNNIMIF